MNRLCLVLCLLAIPAAAVAEESGNFEVHEWGYICINVPPGTNLKETFLRNLPGSVRQVAAPAAGDRQQMVPVGVDSNDTADQPGRSNPRSGVPETPTGTPQTPSETPLPVPIPAPPEGFIFGDPFIWFHSGRALQVSLTVKLGINKPLCWWPQGLDDGNSITWKKLLIDPMPPSDKRASGLESGSSVADQMLRAREVRASYVHTGNKVERFLMYEFSGLCWSGLRLESSCGPELFARNASDRPVKALFVMPEGLGRHLAYFTPFIDSWTNRMGAGGDGRYSSLVDFRVKLCQVLEDEGLNHDEALLMVRAVTGFGKFNESRGVKAVYLLDRDSIEEISKLEFSPKPASVKRVWLALVFDACNYSGLRPVLKDSGRFDLLLETLHNSGAEASDVKEAIRKLDTMRSRE